MWPKAVLNHTKTLVASGEQSKSQPGVSMASAQYISNFSQYPRLPDRLAVVSDWCGYALLPLNASLCKRGCDSPWPYQG